VRDVFILYDRRLQLMITQDNPTFANWDQDKSAVDDAYNDQDPAVVAAELGASADALALRFATVEGPTWQRRGSRSDGAHFTIGSFGRYFIHDPVHHLHDVTMDLSRG